MESCYSPRVQREAHTWIDGCFKTVSKGKNRSHSKELKSGGLNYRRHHIAIEIETNKQKPSNLYSNYSTMLTMWIFFFYFCSCWQGKKHRGSSRRCVWCTPSVVWCLTVIYMNPQFTFTFSYTFPPPTPSQSRFQLVVLASWEFTK